MHRSSDTVRAAAALCISNGAFAVAVVLRIDQDTSIALFTLLS